MTSNISPGFVALHSHRSELLAEHLMAWFRAHPLAPLEPEVVLVQSNGMAEWVKIECARQSGVCAAARLELPSRFLWRMYRQVLGADRVPAESPLDKWPLTWRLMALLPQCLADPVFAPVAGFLGAELQPQPSPDRLLQLASRLADLFDQYQIYRPDWLKNWAAGDDVLTKTSGVQPLAPDQVWQAALWRRILATLDAGQQHAIRPALHALALAHLQSGQPLAGAVPRRVSVFGMSQMPMQLLEMLAALASRSQVLLAVPNPCQFHWADIMDGREWLQTKRKRHAYRGATLADLPLEQMHLHAPTLLAAWGRQARDFVRQLDVFDDVQAAKQLTQLARLDFFDDMPNAQPDRLLTQLQHRIRDLEPSSPQHPPAPLPSGDDSVVFGVAHSPVRELEALHDQLLQWFHRPPGKQPLQPRDVVVMVPNIETMAPAIRAVFGQYKRSDPRFIPFDVADLGAKTLSPLVHAVEWLMALPQQRCQMSELVQLLEVPALSARFGLPQEGLPTLMRWMAESGVRWGLSAAHREDLGLGACGETNSAWFGLQRMLLGYACGADPMPDQHPNLQPYAEVGGLDAEWAGSLAHMLQALDNWWQVCTQPATPADWAERCRGLLAAMFKPQDERDREVLSALDQALTEWTLAADAAGFANDVPWSVAQNAWFKALEMPRLEQRFRAGGVTFCTLMPMRAIPFKAVCLLGMNEGDYPRRSQPSDFDLMGLPGMNRPGDRSRREDDRQLMLEALMSARQVLYISWCGRSVRDNTEQPPSVLVAHLRDEIDLLWGPGTAHGLTKYHPLQPFGRAYFEESGALQTYAHEWQAVQSEGTAADVLPPTTLALAPWMPDQGKPTVNLDQLARFLARPVGAFFKERLQIHWVDEHAEPQDEELFGLDGLTTYQVIEQELNNTPPDLEFDQIATHANRCVARLRQAGGLPLAGVGELEAQKLALLLEGILSAVQCERASFDGVSTRLSVHIDHPLVGLQDVLGGVGHSATGLMVMTVTASRLLQGHDSATPKARPERLVAAWLKALAAAAAGTPVGCVVVGVDAVIRLPQLSQTEAVNQMQVLLNTWAEGMCRPLPLPPALALKWLEAPNNTQALSDVYEGTRWARGELAKDPALARAYPGMADVLASQVLEQLAELVYGPLKHWVASAQVVALADSANRVEAVQS